jgi:hypothetical protein
MSLKIVSRQTCVQISLPHFLFLGGGEMFQPYWLFIMIFIPWTLETHNKLVLKWILRFIYVNEPFFLNYYQCFYFKTCLQKSDTEIAGYESEITLQYCQFTRVSLTLSLQFFPPSNDTFKYSLISVNANSCTFKNITTNDNNKILLNHWW